jgi:hypothetical protein
LADIPHTVGYKIPQRLATIPEVVEGELIELIPSVPPTSSSRASMMAQMFDVLT